MYRSSRTSIAFISSVIVIFFLVLYLTQPSPPGLLRYRRQSGPFPGYKDCLPATKVAFLHHNVGEFSRVVENIFERFALSHHLSYHRGVLAGCSGIFIGIKPDTVEDNTVAHDMCHLELVREALGDEPFIVIAVEQFDNSEAVNYSFNGTIEKLDEVVDLGIVEHKLAESLIVLKHLLCLDYRDITYINHVSVDVIHHHSGTYEFFSRKLQKLIAELEEDVVAREVTILENANENLRRKAK